MWFSVFAQSSIVTRVTTLEELQKETNNGDRFVLFGNSSQFDYPYLFEHTVDVVHQMNLSTPLIIADVYDQDFDISYYNISVVPSLALFSNGKTVAIRNSPLDYGVVLSFLQVHSIAPIIEISTRDDLDDFYTYTSFGVLVPNNISETAKTVINNVNSQHFNEITVAYIDPSLLNQSGYYVYRFTDAQLVYIDDLSELNENELLEVLSMNTIQEFLFPWHNVVHYYEETEQSFLILEEPTYGYYYNSSTIDDIIRIKEKCKMNVTVTSAGLDYTTRSRYSIRPGKNGLITLIDHSTLPMKKYVSDQSPTYDNAAQFCDDFYAKRLKPSFKSIDKTVEHDGISELAAYDVEKFVNSSSVVILGIYYSYPRLLEPVFLAAQKLNQPALGRISMSRNDWPLPQNEPDLGNTLVYVYSHGRYIGQFEPPLTVEQCTSSLKTLLNKIGNNEL